MTVDMAKGQINRSNGAKSLKSATRDEKRDFMANGHLQFVFRGQDDDQGEDSWIIFQTNTVWCIIYVW